MSNYPAIRYPQDNKPKSLFEFLREFIQENGWAPSMREMRDGCGFSSTSIVNLHLKKLEEAGKIVMDRGKPRALRVVGARWVFDNVSM